MRLYVKAANQISMQQPLCEEWLEKPIIVEEEYCRSIDPDFKQYIAPAEARRLGKVLKRAICVSLKTLNDAGLTCPDAIITGTGLGSVESTEAFLTSMCENGEQQLSPTHFMQSTHNTISSAVAIKTKCHGYNSTYSHKDISFQSALYDAYIQIKAGEINNALISGQDGITPAYFHLLQLVDYVGNGMKSPCGEVAMAALIDNKEENALCEFSYCKLLHKPNLERIKDEISRALSSSELSCDNSFILAGVNGKECVDSKYKTIISCCLSNFTILQYKNIFGECFTASALGFYAASIMLSKGIIPDEMFYTSKKDVMPSGILLFDTNRGGDTSIILLKKI